MTTHEDTVKKYESIDDALKSAIRKKLNIDPHIEIVLKENDVARGE